MNSKTTQQHSKLYPSRSVLKLTDSNLKTQFIDKEKHVRSPKPRTAKTNLKTRKLANLLDKPKDNTLDFPPGKNSQDNSNLTNNLSQKGRTFLLESPNNLKNRNSPLNSKSPVKKTNDRNPGTKLVRENRIKPTINLRQLKKKELNYSTVQPSTSIDRSYKVDSNKTYADMTNNLYFPNKALNSTVEHYHTDRVEDYSDFFNEHLSFQEINYAKRNLQKSTGSHEALPLGRQCLQDSKSKLGNVLNIAPNHTPQSSFGSPHEISEQMLTNKIHRREQKALFLQNDVPIGREVIIINNQTICSTTATLVERSVPNNSTPSSSQQSHKKENPSIFKEQRPCNISFEDVVQQEERSEEESKGGHYIEDKIEALLINKNVDATQINEINDFFENYTEEAADCLERKSEVTKHKDALKKIKLAYEIFFKNHATGEQRQSDKIAAESKELSFRNGLLHERLRERRNLSHNRGANHNSDHLYPSNKIHYRPILRTNHSPAPSELLSANKKNSSGRNESPPITKVASSLEKDRETLRSIISSQQRQISQLKQREIDMVKLAEACQKRGIDIMGIYDEEIIGKKEQVQDCDLPTANKSGHSSKNYLNLKQLLSANTVKTNEGKADNDLPSAHPSSSRTAHDSKVESECKDHSSDLLIISEDESRMEQLKQSNSNPVLKNKLKLDFTALTNKNKDQQAGVPGINLNGVIKSEKEPVGFHQEFMSRLDEFSLSWRLAAQKERKIP